MEATTMPSPDNDQARRKRSIRIGLLLGACALFWYLLGMWILWKK